MASEISTGRVASCTATKPNWPATIVGKPSDKTARVAAKTRLCHRLYNTAGHGGSRSQGPMLCVAVTTKMAGIRSLIINYLRWLWRNV